MDRCCPLRDLQVHRDSRALVRLRRPLPRLLALLHLLRVLAIPVRPQNVPRPQGQPRQRWYGTSEIYQHRVSNTTQALT